MQVLNEGLTAQSPGDAAPDLVQARAVIARQINASTLFGSAREIVIVHNAREYRLRITAQQKLILTA
jgi:hemin uptake protein HemP